ncbi:DNA (cytosine-5-)-methyltransferase [Clostridium perfringens]|uniref:DNA (cytosine-5-)-methyltransferase n=1 Tax=Clostridium perfringens TaxID=1502 RepID=UPI0039EBC5EF
MSQLTLFSIDKKDDIDILIKEKRERLGMTPKELADAIGLPRYGEKTIRNWESGKEIPSKIQLEKILNFPEEAPFKNPDNAKYKMIDLFAGIGGTRLGFQLNGNVEVVFTSEWDKFCQKTYKANYGEYPHGDITEIDEKDIPDHDILVAGFPCQAFSQAGLKKGFEDTRGTLFFDVARILKEKKPKAFLLENVKNLRTHDNGKTFEVIEKTLVDLGYEITVMMYKARDFGVPQNRERIYIVGFNKNTVKGYKNFKTPVAPKPNTRVGYILEENVEDKYTISDKLWEGHQRRKIENKKKGKGFGFTLFNEESQYTNTLSARYYKDGSEILIEQKGKNPRKITPREASRLQGFPNEFIIPVSDSQSYKQFGNSVCVPVIKAIAKEILNVLDNEEEHRVVREKSKTASVYVVYENKVLLHMHKKYNTLFPLGGKMNNNESPHETAIREAYEESGIDIEIYSTDKKLNLGRVIQLYNPMYTLLENVGDEVENIDFIYFAKALSNKVKPQIGESKELYWLTKDDIEKNENIKPHVKAMALEALSILKE